MQILLHKLGKLRAHERDSDDLLKFVIQEQMRRGLQRSAGRVIRAAKDSNRKPKIMTLENLGIDPSLCQRLRASGQSEMALITKVRKAGLI